MHRDLRVIGTGLNGQIAAAASHVEPVAGERGQVDERRRTLLPEAEPAVEQVLIPLMLTVSSDLARRTQLVFCGA